jgi:hypothetical protein
MSTFADEVRNYPMLFSLLDVFDSEPGYLRSSEATAEENGDHGIVAFGTQAFSAERSEESLPLVNSQPIPDAHAMLLYALHPADSSRKVGLRSPQSAASYASRRMAARRRLIVDEAYWACSRLIR